MAAEGEVPERMLKDHVSGYEGFVSLMKWGTIISVLIGFLVMFVISN